MSNTYVPDKNIAGYAIKGDSLVREHIRKIPAALLMMPAVAKAELRYGLARRPHGERLRRIVGEFLLNVTILPFDSFAAQRYGLLRAELERAGTAIGNLDMMIGAHALSLHAVLVTNDRAFSRIKELKLEDWTQPD